MYDEDYHAWLLFMEGEEFNFKEIHDMIEFAMERI